MTDAPGVPAVPGATRLTPGGRHGAWDPAPAELVVCDVDGTLVGPDGDVSDEVVAACRAALAAGLHVGVATGRLLGGIERVIERTGLPGPHVVSNGGVVVHEGSVLASWPVDPAAVDALVVDCQQRGVYLEVYVPDGFVTTTDDSRASVHWDLLGREPLHVLHAGETVDHDVSKVTALVFDGADPTSVAELLRSHGLTADAGTSPATPGVSYVNGTHPAADKGIALRTGAERLGIDVAATVALGDADNDLSMLGVAGTAVAMGQADARVHAASHLVTGPVEQHGAATALTAAAAGWPGLGPPG